MLGYQAVEKGQAVFDLVVFGLANSVHFDFFVLEFVPVCDQHEFCQDCNAVVLEINELLDAVFRSCVLPIFEWEVCFFLALFPVVTQAERHDCMTLCQV